MHPSNLHKQAGMVGILWLLRGNPILMGITHKIQVNVSQQSWKETEPTIVSERNNQASQGPSIIHGGTEAEYVTFSNS